MATQYEVRQIIVDLSAAFPDWKPPNMAGTIKQYEDALKGCQVDLLKQAADRCRDSCLFFPKIAELRKAYAEIRVAYYPNSKDSNESWKDKEWKPIAAKTQKMLDDFRARMVSRGLWKEARRNALETGDR